MRLIGLHGDLESGKDTVGDYLVKNHGYSRVSIGYHIRHEMINLGSGGCIRLSPYMPDAIYATIVRLNNMNAVESHRAVWEKPTPLDIREALQWYGIWRRSQDKYHWLKQLRWRLRTVKKDRLVMTDMRMPEEFQLVMDHGGETWTIQRRRSSEVPDHVKQHITENALRGYNFRQYINNNGTLAELESIVAQLVKTYDL